MDRSTKLIQWAGLKNSHNIRPPPGKSAWAIMKPESPVLFSIGHSSHELERFIELLQQHRIEVLADVRSQPFSGYTPQFNRELLKSSIQNAGLKYLFLGDQLGGRPEGNQYYDAAGHVLYYRVAESDSFRAGIERLKTGAQQYRVAMMCSEEDPTICHRFLLVSRVLTDLGLDVRHIRGDGTVQNEREVCGISRDNRRQGLLFADMEDETWKSIRSVLPKAAPNGFSAD